MKKEYYLGLDMGTSSVGWAVTDENYNLIRVKGKDFWGVREFDEALTAVERRSKRISRRRRQREKARIGLLQAYFDEIIEKEDPLFFIRMKNSKYFLEDKDDCVKNKNAIFDDSDYKDVDYYTQYPTIFHLRKALLEDTVPKDHKYGRLLYLALLNMFKNRGHFLNASLSDKDEDISLRYSYEKFVQLADLLFSFSFPSDIADEIQNILADRTKSRSVKAEDISKLCKFTKSDKKQVLLIRCMCGLKVDAKKLFEDIETEEKAEIYFGDFSYEEKAENLKNILGEEYYEFIEIIKQIYDSGVLANILHGDTYLSVARVKEYEKHHQDLQLLKEVMKEYCSEEEYNKMFRMEIPGSYSAYVKSVNSSEIEGNKPVRRSIGGGSRELLYKTIKDNSSLKAAIGDSRVDKILKDIENETFLPKQHGPGNGVIPNQVHKKEMAAILRNAEKYMDFLKEKDETGLPVSERIIRLFSFQIPYYVGPLSEKSKTGWVVRKETGQVLPWNLEDKVDIEKTSEEFIRKLVRKCTFLNDESVLPKASLEYEAYSVLNEINNIKINGEKISVEVKQGIYRDLFCAGKKVTRKQLEKYLMNRGLMKESSELTGIDSSINNSLASYGKFFAVFGEKLETDTYKRITERIIYLATVYGDSKKMLKSRLEKEFGDILSTTEIKRILGYKFKDWGRLSKGILELSGCEKETGEIKSLIRTMWDTNYNFMELIHSNLYTFGDELNARKYKAECALAEFKAEDLDEFYFSAPVKRMIWQTILLIQEVEKVMGNPPSRVFIEMTRSDDEKKGDKGRKDSRSKQLLELYKSVKNETREWEKEIQTAGENGSLRSKKLYLYYMQMGRCMYTGEPIELDELFTTKYDIDHIYPRHYVKDDNISNNLVLVNKASNAYKSDNYPLPAMPKKVYDLWKRLHDSKPQFISDEKYRRLTSRNAFTDEQKAGFIARQLVETSQGTKGIADLLKQLLPEPETTVVYAKARNVSDFRRDYGFLKSRIVNDFHHAKDAYLNIVVGNVYYTKFTQNPMNFIKKELAFNEKKYRYNLGKMYAWDVERNGKVAWIASDDKSGEEGTIAVVRKVMNKNTPLMTRMTFEAKGGIANETLYPAKKAKKENYIPLKSSDEKMSDVTKYGGFTSVSNTYFFLVEHEEKKKKIRTLESLPIYMKEKVERTEDGLLNYCRDELKLKNPRICLKEIKIQSLVSLDGYKVRLSGKTGDRIILRNEVSMCLYQEWVNYIHDIEKYMETKQFPESISSEKNIELYKILSYKHGNEIFSKRQNPVGEKLTNGLNYFMNTILEKQCYLINEILKLSSIGPTAADLSAIGGAAKSGIMLYSKNISKAKEFILINQSVTGIYEKTVDLLTI